MSLYQEWREKRNERNKTNRRNLVLTGNYDVIPKSIIEFYEDEKNEDVYEIYLNGEKIVNYENLYKIMKNFREKYVRRDHHEIVKETNKALNLRNECLEKELRAVKEEKEEDIRREYKKICYENNEAFKKIIEKETEQKLQQIQDEYESKLNKWKAMYTGQCEANRILIEKLGGITND